MRHVRVNKNMPSVQAYNRYFDTALMFHLIIERAALWRSDHSHAGSSRTLSPCCPACTGGQKWWHLSPLPSALVALARILIEPDTRLITQRLCLSSACHWRACVWLKHTGHDNRKSLKVLMVGLTQLCLKQIHTLFKLVDFSLQACFHGFILTIEILMQYMVSLINSRLLHSYSSFLLVNELLFICLTAKHL